MLSSLRRALCRTAVFDFDDVRYLDFFSCVDGHLGVSSKPQIPKIFSSIIF